MNRAEPAIHVDPAARLSRLTGLGLDEEVIRRAVLAGEEERRDTSPFDPTIAAPFRAWAATIRALGEALASAGWRKHEFRNFPRIAHSVTKKAIAVVGGNEGTGRDDRHPTCRGTRGPRSIAVVEANRQRVLFPQPEFVALPKDDKEFETWWLLVYSGGGELRAELSLPIGLGDDLRFSDWKERILIPMPDLSADAFSWELQDEPIEVSVRPKQTEG